MFLFLVCSRHFRQACQRLCHAAHLSGDVHIPHLIAVAGTLTTLILSAITFDVGAIVQAVPYPQSHVLGYEQRLVGCFFVVNIGGDVDETCQLFVYGVVGRPHPVVVVVGTIHLDEYTMLGGNGVQIAIAILLVLLLIMVEIFPSALHGLQLLLGSEIACLPVAFQLLVPYKRAFLTLAQAIDHLCDVTAQDVLLCLILTAGKGEGQCRHVVPRAVPLQLCCG